MKQGEVLQELRWYLAAGFGACLAYPLGVFAPLPTIVRTILVAAFGPLLAIGSYGLMRVIELQSPSVRARMAVVSNAIAGALFVSMILVQLAAGHRGEDAWAQPVWLGLDVAFDLYMGLGTLLFAIVVLTAPPFGKVFGLSGIIIAAILLVFNFATFPTPPANAGLFDAGPLVGLWYFAITIASFRELRRMRGREVPETIAA